MKNTVKCDLLSVNRRFEQCYNRLKCIWKTHSFSFTERNEMKGWNPTKKKWKCATSQWALRSKGSSVCETEVWLPPTVWHKNNNLHSHAGDKKANQISMISAYTVFWWKNNYFITAEICIVFTKVGQSYWFCKFFVMQILPLCLR